MSIGFRSGCGFGGDAACTRLLQGSVRMSYRNTDRLQMRTLQTETPAVHRIRRGEKSMNESFESLNVHHRKTVPGKNQFLVKLRNKKRQEKKHLFNRVHIPSFSNVNDPKISLYGPPWIR